ncbi:MAG: sigma-70 family RNA polymerase sigma factor [Deltaproteobacteria bacterium]|nr:sigma-70 family RNA polymerase sigma factor [Deltaproteobacteria bacterium]
MPDASKPGQEGAGAVSWAEMDDDMLVRLVQRENRRAADELVRRYQQKVFRVAYLMSRRDREDAKDMVQEAFFRAFQGIKKFDGKSSFYTWLYRIVVNTCLSSRRRYFRWSGALFQRHSREFKEEDPETKDESPDPMDELSGRQLREEIRATLDSLPKKQRTVFYLKIFEEMTIHDISCITGMAEGTVKTHIFRATRTVRNRLKKWKE